MIKSFIAFFFTVFLLSFSAYANDRQNKHDLALQDSQLLLTAIQDGKSKNEIRERIVILAESLKVLAFSEAEARVSDKIAPPPGAKLPTSLNEIAIMDQQPGPITTIDNVPNDWFTGYLEKSRGLVGVILKEHDQSNSDLIYVQAESVKKAIENIIQPPQ